MTHALLISLALLAAWLPLPAEWVETWYSRGLYPAVQHGLTAFSNAIPVALFDVLLLAALVGLAGTWTASLASARGERRRRALRLLLRTATFAAVVYLAFLAIWGLNYRRVPLASQLEFSDSRIDEAALRRLDALTVSRLNLLGPAVDGIAWPELRDLPERLSAPLTETLARLPGAPAIVTGVPKRSLLSFYFTRAGIDGMIDPFFLEVLVDHDILPFERPFVVAHEWAHLAGYADESEASFVGLLVCLRGDVPAQYSGWLALYPYVLRHLPREGQHASMERLGDVPRRHLREMAERARRMNPVVRRAANQAYDRFLKANRVQAGVESYGRVVRLVLGTGLDVEWGAGAAPEGVR